MGRKYVKSFGAAKMDHREAARYCAGSAARAKRTAKRDLRRAERRNGKALAASH